MGRIIKYREIAKSQKLSGMQVYCGGFHTLDGARFSVNKPLAEALLKIASSARTMQLDRCLHDLMQNLPTDGVVEDIDVLFSPVLKIDVLTLLISLWKSKPFRLKWPGSLINNALVYSEEGRPDYRMFPIEDYDILCII